MRAMKQYLCFSLPVNVLTLAAALAMGFIAHQYQSFFGPAALVMAFFLLPGVFMTLAALLFLLEAAGKKRSAALRTASILQIAAPLPWLLFASAFGSAESWFELALGLQLFSGAAGLLLLLSGHGE